MKRNNLNRFRYLKYGFPLTKKGNIIDMNTQEPFNEMLRGDAADDCADVTSKKLLQIVNLAPSETWLERVQDIHPMKQITYAAIVQVIVFGFMLLSFGTINALLN